MYISTDFFIEHVKRDHAYTMDSFDEHQGYEIYYLHGGVRHYFIQNKTYTIRPGDVVLIDKHDLHKTIEPGTNSHERTVVNFNDRFLESFGNYSQELLKIFQSGHKVLSLSNQEQLLIEPLLLQLRQEYESPTQMNVLLLRILIIQLLIALERISGHSAPDACSALPVRNKAAAEIVHYLEAHYAKPFKLHELSSLHNISPYYLCRSFKAYTGFTPVEYLRHVRLNKARERLIVSNDLIQSIAEQVGYSSTIHFNREFKLVVGITPSQFRKRNKMQVPL